MSLISSELLKFKGCQMLTEYENEISELKQSNAHFNKIFEKHSELDKKIEDAERGRINISSIEIDTMKKEKLLLKDKIYNMILEAKRKLEE